MRCRIVRRRGRNGPSGSQGQDEVKRTRVRDGRVSEEEADRTRGSHSVGSGGTKESGEDDGGPSIGHGVAAIGRAVRTCVAVPGGPIDAIDAH